MTNGCYRLHPVEWNIGEVAGNLAAACLAQKCFPREIRNNPKKLKDFQNLLIKKGIEKTARSYETICNYIQSELKW